MSRTFTVYHSKSQYITVKLLCIINYLKHLEVLNHGANPVRTSTQSLGPGSNPQAM